MDSEDQGSYILMLYQKYEYENKIASFLMLFCVLQTFKILRI